MTRLTETYTSSKPAAGLKLSVGERVLYFLQALRPLHWVKNSFVFVALVFAGKLFDADALMINLAAFGVFSLAAAAIYLFNDICDRREDAEHPSKRMRPITRGLVGVHDALFGAVVLASVSVVLSYAIHLKFGHIVVLYLVLNAGYSVYLKRIVILDVLIIAAGFVLRLLAGGAVTGYRLSSWMLIATFFLATLIAFSKRRYEILYDGNSPMNTKGYTPYFLDLLVVLSATSVIGAYAFYVLSRGNWQNGFAILTSIGVVFYGVVRYVYLIHRTEEKLDHTKLILSDKPLMAAVLIWIGLFITEIYYINPNLTLPV